MTVKEQLREVLENLPDDATLEGAMERLYIAAELECRVQEMDQGAGIPQEEVFKRLRAKWDK